MPSCESYYLTPKSKREQSKRGKRATYELESQRKSSTLFKFEMAKLFDLSFHFAISHHSMILIFSYTRTKI